MIATIYLDWLMDYLEKMFEQHLEKWKRLSEKLRSKP